MRAMDSMRGPSPSTFAPFTPQPKLPWRADGDGVARGHEMSGRVPLEAHVKLGFISLLSPHFALRIDPLVGCPSAGARGAL